MRIRILPVLTMILATSPVQTQGLQSGPANSATDISAEEIEAVAAAIGNQIDLQIKVAAISQGNVAVGVLHRDRLTNEGGPARGLVHRQVSEVYISLRILEDYSTTSTRTYPFVQQQ